MNRMMVGLAVAMTVGAVWAAAPTVAELNAKFGKDGKVSFRADAKGEPIAVLKDANGVCEIALRGAHVQKCEFAGDEHPLLYVPKTGYYPVGDDRAFIHGGVPLLWPWFGGSGAPKLPLAWWQTCLNCVGCSYKPVEGPFHATSRYSLFSVREVSSVKGETSITLILGPCPEVAEFTSGVFELEYRITLGNHKLGLALTTKNLGPEPFKVREGYHPYFAVSNCFALTLDGVDGCWYESTRDLPYDLDQIWHGKVPEWPGCDQFKFKEPKSVITLSDPNWKRDIVLTTTGARDVITWCQDLKSAKKGGMNIKAKESYDFFCIEPANYYAASEVSVQQGETHTFETIITVKENRK